MNPILQTVLGIGFLIFIHEFGHYLCARLVGIRVEVFSLGFGTRLLGFQRGGTDYRLSLVPLGGYVRVAGEDATRQGRPLPGDLHSKSVLARLFFFSGGVVMNVVFALVAFPFVFHGGVRFNAPLLGSIAKGGPAWQAGLQPGDRILEVDGKRMYSFDNMRVEIALAGDRDVQLRLQRGTDVFERKVHPRYQAGRGLYAIGVAGPADPTPPHLRVSTGSPAARAGLRSGDVLVRLDGRTVTGKNVFDILTEAEREPHPLQLEVIRNGTRHSARFTPGRTETGHYMIGVARASRRVIAIRGHQEALGALGLRIGDHILDIDGSPFTQGAFARIVEGSGRLRLRVRRGSEPIELAADLSSTDRRSLVEHVALGPDTLGVVVDPLPGSAAADIGMRSGDEILAIEGVPIASWKELRDAVLDSRGRPLKMTVRRGTKKLELRVQPSGSVMDPGFTALQKPLRELYRVEGVSEALAAGWVCSMDQIKQLYVTLKKMVTGEVAAKNLGGIITIARVSYDFAESGWALFIYFLAVLSLNLAFINVLPIPVLDGGHLLFLAIEGIKGSPVSPRVLGYSQLAGLVFVLALIVFVTYNDILRLL